MGYLRFRFFNIKFKLFVLGLGLPYEKDFLFFFFFFFNLFTLNSKFLTVWFFCLTDKTQVNHQISLINVPALNYLLRSQIFVNDDGQLLAAHLILDYKPLSRSFLDVSNVIKANDYRLAR